MASKSLELVIRELQKTVQLLVSKISALECQVCNQNEVIVNQSKILADLGIQKTDSAKTQSTRKSVENVSSASAPQQRLKRLAHVNAAAAITSVPKKRSAVSAASTLSIPPSINLTKTPEVSRSSPIQITAVSDAAATKIAIGDEKQDDSMITTTDGNKSNEIQDDTNTGNKTYKDDINDNSENDWQTVNVKKQRKRRKIIIGAGKEDDELQTVEKMKYIQAWSFKPDTTVDNISKIAKSEFYYVEKRDIKTNRHASFVIGVPESLYDCICTPTVWPPGVRFAEWFLTRPRV